MRAQLKLLEYVVMAWDIQTQCFRLGAYTLSINVEKIYFLIGLSRRIAPIALYGMRRGGDTIKA